MATKKKRFMSPVGKSQYSWLMKPDVKYNDNGVYKTNLLVPEEDAGDLAEMLNKIVDTEGLQLAKEAIDSLKQPGKQPKGQKRMSLAQYKAYMLETLEKVEPAEPNYDNETGEETGEIVFKFKMNATFKDKKTGEIKELRPLIFDGAGKKITDKNLIVGFGSTIQVSYTYQVWYMAKDNLYGVTLYMSAVQIISLAGGGAGASAESYGFGTDGDAYVPAEGDKKAEGDDDYSGPAVDPGEEGAESEVPF